MEAPPARSEKFVLLPMLLRLLRLPLPAAAILVLLAAPLSGQSDRSIPIPALPDSTRSRILGEITPPAGFELTIFAAPPHLTYPTCLYPADGGVVYVCTDPNLLFGRERYLGRVLRFVDADGDGIAERYTVFADSLDSVRGITVVGDEVFLMHAPVLAAYRDSDGDGVADSRRVVVEGLGFGLDDRNGDHTANSLRLGLDGAIYVAVGDYGFLRATGTDGRQIYLHRGGVIRVRPDGTELEIVARGTRNIFDLALDSHLRIFTRDNNNNGQGWNSVFHYLPVGADAGYPSLFRNFREEIHPVLADYGAGAATTTLWLDEPSYPAPLSRGLLSADWALNRIFHHQVTPVGGTFRITQEEVMTVPRPVDAEVGPNGFLYVASLSGGSYDYAGEHVGYVVRLRPLSTPAPHPSLDDADEATLVNALLAPSQSRRLQAQRAILDRGATAGLRRRLEAAVSERDAPVAGRIAALFTLKQLTGPASHATLLRAAEDPALREAALRALVDRQSELGGVPPSLYLEALSDSSAAVRLQAIRGLSRLVPPEAAGALMRAAVDPDPTVAHVARNELAALGPAAVPAALNALDSGDPSARSAALQVLSRLHAPSVVTELARRCDGVDAEARVEILGGLARLYHREGFWDGAWWGNQPSTEGPYFAPVEWSESPRIRTRLLEGILEAEEEVRTSLLERFEREGVLPRESSTLLQVAAQANRKQYAELAELLLGGRELAPVALKRLAQLSSAQPALREAAVRVVTALPSPPLEAAPLLAEAAAANSLPAALRARALTAVTRTTPADHDRVTVAFAAVIPSLPDHPELLQAWRRYVGDRQRAEELDHFLALAAGGDENIRTLGFAVLVQVAALPRVDERIRDRARDAIAAGWKDAEAAAALQRAIRLMEAEDRYPEQLGGG